MEFRCFIRQLIGLSLAVGLLAIFLASSPAQAQEPPGSQGLWQTFTTANSGLRDERVTSLLEDRAGGIWVGTEGGGVSHYFEGTWQTFSIETGSLGNDNVYELLEDEDGGVWVSTDGGVSRYFEGTWQTFSIESGSLGSNVVSALLEDRAGGLWVGTFYGGVSRYFEGTWQTFSFESGSLGDDHVTALLEDRAGGLWVGTDEGGVSHYLEGTWHTLSIETSSLGSNHVGALLEDRAGGVWVGTDGGVSRYFEGTWQSFSVESRNLVDNNVWGLLEDRAGGVWVGTDGGVSRYFQGAWQTFSVENGSLSNNYVSELLEDRAGGLWVGTWGGGVSRYFQGAWQTFSTDTDSLGHNQVTALLEDRAGGVWVGTHDGGMSRYFEGTWQSFSTETGDLGDNRVTKLLEDRDGGVWVSTYGGVSRYFEGTWQTFSAESGSLGSNLVTALLEDRAGRVWVGTAPRWYGQKQISGGVSRYFEGSWQTFSTESGSLGNNHVTALLEDRAGGVWVGTDGGVSRYFQGTWQTFSAQSGSLGSNLVTALLEDRAGGVWVGTLYGGVSRYFQGTWQIFSAETGSLGHDEVWALLEDRAGGVWVGTLYGGVSRYWQGTWQTFSTESGSLGSNRVTALLEDQAGGVWVGTGTASRGAVTIITTGGGGGVSRYLEGTWQTFSAETSSLGSNGGTPLLGDRAGGVWVSTEGGVSRYFEGTWQTFSTESSSLGNNHVTALLEDRAGGVWVGTFGGGVSYHRPGSYRPWVLLRQLEVEQEERTQSYDLSGRNETEMSLDFPVERLTIHFAGFDLDSHPDDICYFYQLEGWDLKRRPIAQGVAQYTNLPPGRYTFVVQSLDEDLTFSPEARLAIVIPPPFWRTGWFWGSVALLAVGAVIGTVGGARRWRRLRRLADWQAGHDPYIVGDVVEEPEKFYGREGALADLLRALEAGNHVALYGERRIGKTSLLYQLAHRLREMGDTGAYSYLPVFVSLQVVPEARFFYALMRAIGGVARGYLNERGQPLPSLLADERSAGYDSLDMANDLETVLESLRKVTDRPVRIVLLLDEADKMNGYDPHTQEGLRGLLMTPLGRQVKLVWSGQTMNREWHLETSPWFNLFKHEINLVGLEEEAAVHLIRQPVRGVFTYDDEAVARILHHSDHKPYTIQRLCSFCIRQLLAENRFQVTVEDVETAYQAMQDEDARRAAEGVAPQTVYAPQAPVQSLAEGQGEYEADELSSEEEEEG